MSEAEVFRFREDLREQGYEIAPIKSRRGGRH
jgi:hypothetical protein